jgi:hypothetical protein
VAGEDDARREAGAHRQQALREHKRQHAARWRAQRPAQAEFLRALGHRVGEHAIHAEHAQPETERRKDAQEQGRELALGERARHRLVEGADRRHRQRRIEVAHDGTERRE